MEEVEGLPAEVAVEVTGSGVIAVDCGIRSHTHTLTHTHTHTRTYTHTLTHMHTHTHTHTHTSNTFIITYI